MNYVLTKDPEKLKQFMALILERTKVTEEEVVKRLKTLGKPPNWINRMEAVKTLVGGVEACHLCAAPVYKGKCVLFPVHTRIKYQLQLGERCGHDLYVVECQSCIDALRIGVDINNQNYWKEITDGTTIRIGGVTE